MTQLDKHDAAEPLAQLSGRPVDAPASAPAAYS